MANYRPGKKKLKLRKSFERQVTKVFQQNSSKLLNYKQVAKKLNVNDEPSKLLIRDVMNGLSIQNKLMEVERGKFRLKGHAAVLEGRIQFTRHGSAYVISDDSEVDLFVHNKNVGKALDGDRVKISVITGRKKPEGRVIEVVERKKLQFTGLIETNGKSTFLVTDSARMHRDIYIPQSKTKGAENGQKVLVKFTDWPEEASNPFGEVLEVLGNPGENEVEMNSILADHGFPLRFPNHVEKAAAAIPTEISEEEISKREDFREVLTFTIDPDDAKDFDDALSYRKLADGKLEIGIHIADVTHYVEPGSALDKEAIERATSIYLVDRVIPMLPEVLSNQLCSLRPNETKLCFSVIFTLDEQGNIHDKRIRKTVIHSDRRFTYNEVQTILEAGKGELVEALTSLNNIAKILRNKRMGNGAIGFEKTEVKFRLNDAGEPAEILFKVQKDAHKLIEEFMLLANRSVAEKTGKRGGKEAPKTFVYRIHDQPNPDRVTSFVEFIRQFGYKLTNASGGSISKSLNKLLAEVKGKPEQNAIETLAIRTMAKAEYSTENIGHYGLAFQYYSHFTSPIRRYPDMIAHRLLFDYANGKNSADPTFIEHLCKHCSEMERKSAEAERDSTKYFQVLFMKDSKGQEFDGIVSGVTEWGMFVEITENKCEGMVRLRDLSDDYYSYDDQRHGIVGHNSGRMIQLGDEVKIKVANIDIPNKRLDFHLIGTYTDHDPLVVLD